MFKVLMTVGLFAADVVASAMWGVFDIVHAFLWPVFAGLLAVFPTINRWADQLIGRDDAQ